MKGIFIGVGLALSYVLAILLIVPWIGPLFQLYSRWVAQVIL